MNGIEAKKAAFHYCELRGIKPESMVHIDHETVAPQWWVIAGELQDLSYKMESVVAGKSRDQLLENE